MNPDEAMRRLTEVIRPKLLALAAESGFMRYCDNLKRLTFHLPSEQKLQRFLTALAKNCGAPSTQDQAIKAIIFLRRGPERGVEKRPGFAGQKAGLDSTRPNADRNQ